MSSWVLRHLIRRIGGDHDVGPTDLPYATLAASFVLGGFVVCLFLVVSNLIEWLGPNRFWRSSSESGIFGIIFSTFGGFLFFTGTLLLGLWGVAYSVLSYKQTLKIESQIRSSITSYRAFVRHGFHIMRDAFEKVEAGDSVNVRLVLWFPYFRITEDLGSDGDHMSDILFDLRASRADVDLITTEDPFAFGANVFTGSLDPHRSDPEWARANKLIVQYLDQLAAKNLAHCPTNQWEAHLETVGALDEDESGSNLQAVRDCVQNFHMLFTPKQKTNLSGHWRVFRVPTREVAAMFFQIVWTEQKAVIVFLPPITTATAGRTRGSGFVTEDPEMIEAIRQILEIAQQVSSRANGGA